MLNYNNNYNNKIDLASFSKIFDESFSNFTAFYSDLNNENILYRNMYAKVRHLSSKIKSRTKNDGNKILLFLDSGLDFVTVFYAVIYSRNIPILINNKVKTEINGLIQKYDYIMTDEKNVQNVRKYLNVAHKKDTIIYVDDSYSEPLGEQINDAGDNFRYCFTIYSIQEFIAVAIFGFYCPETDFKGNPLIRGQVILYSFHGLGGNPVAASINFSFTTTASVDNRRQAN